METIHDTMRKWIAKEFNPKYHDRVCNEFLDHMTGNKTGNAFTAKACEEIIKIHKETKENKHENN